MKSTYDLKNNLGGGVSVKPGTSYDDSGDVEGDWVDCQTLEGPIQAICATGSVSGAATAQSINFELYEADDSSGTGAQKISTQTEATITADKTQAVAHGLRTKRYVKVHIESADSSFTGGSGPSQDVSALVVGQKKIV